MRIERDFHRRVSLGMPCALLVWLCFATAARGEGPADGGAVSYYESVKPIFAVNCHKCHGAETSKNGFRLDLAERALAGGESGNPGIVGGNTSKGELYRRITSDDLDQRMPPKGPRLSAHEIELIRRWIEQGAKWPARDDYWAFAPPRKQVVPEVASGLAGRNPIDHFISARLASEGIVAVGQADARTLLRRAYADLLGVPPSPQEAEAFLNDQSADAFEKLIDRLLADPRYGERWARHWLDLARYGESDGYEDDKVRPHAWRYRDYVIRSFNADKPYDRFVQEQIAGDEIWPDDPDAWVATGFARLGSWDGMSKDPARQRQDFLNDATDAVGAVFLGMTVGCARCHDHKYDRITQQDYYGLQAFFAGVHRDTRNLPGDLHDCEPVREAYQAANSELQKLQAERDALMVRARKAIDEERRSNADQNTKAKTGDAEVMRKAEAIQPGRLAQIAARSKDLEPRQRLYSPVAEVVFETFARSPRTVILKGGELSRPGAEVAPRFVEAMSPVGRSIASVSPLAGGKSSGRRTALARWLTSPENPLVARVLVNRLWQHHFGVGIVATPSDFGRNGKQPTNRELLDWLACRFIEDGFSIKKMQKLMMTSAAYRRSSGPDAAASAKDPDNHLLWRMSRRRLESEAIRDTILAVSGQLNSGMGGPGIYAKLPKSVNIEFPNNDKELSWGAATDEESRRRSVYLFQRRSLTFPLMEVFDAAAMNQSCPVRAQTTVAPQALALFNGEFTREAAAHFAERLVRKAGGEPPAQVDLAFWIAFARRPTETERSQSVAFIVEQGQRRNADGEKARTTALVDFCHVLLNANELIYPD